MVGGGQYLSNIVQGEVNQQRVITLCWVGVQAY